MNGVTLCLAPRFWDIGTQIVTSVRRRQMTYLGSGGPGTARPDMTEEDTRVGPATVGVVLNCPRYALITPLLRRLWSGLSFGRWHSRPQSTSSARISRAVSRTTRSTSHGTQSGTRLCAALACRSHVPPDADDGNPFQVSLVVLVSSPGWVRLSFVRW